MTKQIDKAAAKASAEAAKIVDTLYTAMEGKPGYDEMTEAVSEEIARIEAENDHPVIRAEFKTIALRAIAAEFGIKL